MTTNLLSVIELPDGATLHKEPKGRQLWYLARNNAHVRYLNEFEAMFIEASLTAGRAALSHTKPESTSTANGAAITHENGQATEPAPSTAGEQDMRDAQEAPFEAWWDSMGQYGRAGGSGYEKTFAWNAWCAALLSAPALPAAAMPVGELTDEQCRDIWHKCCAEWLGAGNNPYLSYARAILAAASTQPVREPLTEERIQEITADNSLDSVHAIVRATERAHGITKKGAP